MLLGLALLPFDNRHSSVADGQRICVEVQVGTEALHRITVHHDGGQSGIAGHRPIEVERIGVLGHAVFGCHNQVDSRVAGQYIHLLSGHHQFSTYLRNNGLRRQVEAIDIVHRSKLHMAVTLGVEIAELHAVQQNVRQCSIRRLSLHINNHRINLLIDAILRHNGQRVFDGVDAAVRCKHRVGRDVAGLEVILRGPRDLYLLGHRRCGVVVTTCLEALYRHIVHQYTRQRGVMTRLGLYSYRVAATMQRVSRSDINLCRRSGHFGRTHLTGQHIHFRAGIGRNELDSRHRRFGSLDIRCGQYDYIRRGIAAEARNSHTVNQYSCQVGIRRQVILQCYHVRFTDGAVLCRYHNGIDAIFLRDSHLLLVLFRQGCQQRGGRCTNHLVVMQRGHEAIQRIAVNQYRLQLRIRRERRGKQHLVGMLLRTIYLPLHTGRTLHIDNRVGQILAHKRHMVGTRSRVVVFRGSKLTHRHTIQTQRTQLTCGHERCCRQTNDIRSGVTVLGGYQQATVVAVHGLSITHLRETQVGQTLRIQRVLAYFRIETGYVRDIRQFRVIT